MRGCALFARVVDPRVKAAPIIINALAKTLKENEHPDHGNETSGENDEKWKFFKPRCLDASN